jgi:hypothetical protein
MRLMGYPANKISFLTTYNGQKALLKDVVEQRCAHNPLFGRPARITTVDKFQGQQVGHLACWRGSCVGSAPGAAHAPCPDLS